MRAGAIDASRPQLSSHVWVARQHEAGVSARALLALVECGRVAVAARVDGDAQPDTLAHISEQAEEISATLARLHANARLTI